MTQLDLATSYLRSAQRRLLTLPVLRENGGYNDVVREAQGIVELALKSMLRAIGIDPPHLHDVGSILLQNTERFREVVRPALPKLAEASRELRRNRELSFYGAPDFLPDQEYTPADAERAIVQATEAVSAASLIVDPGAVPSA